MTTPIPARFAPPPSDHLGIAHPRPVCQVCDRAVATAEAAPTELAYRNDPRASLRVCDDVDCRRAAARIVPAVVAALAAHNAALARFNDAEKVLRRMSEEPSR